MRVRLYRLRSIRRFDGANRPASPPQRACHPWSSTGDPGRLRIPRLAAIGLCLSVLSLVAPLHAEELVVFDETFQRDADKPFQAQRQFAAPAATVFYTLRLDNGANGQFNEISSAIVRLNGIEILDQNNFNQKVKTIEKPVTLGIQNTLQVELRSGPAGGFRLRLIAVPIPVVTITSPQNFTLFGASDNPITVTGTVDDPTANVTVNGKPAGSGGVFSTSLQLKEGNNIITAVATNAKGGTGTASVQVSVDTAPPQVTIDSPRNGSISFVPFVTVIGMINDIVVGTVNGDQATVMVNGQPAQVANRGFSLADLPLIPGPNLITAVGRDRAGNMATATSTVIFQEPIIGQAVIVPVSGNNQTGVIGTQLPQSLVALLKNGAGAPAANKTAIFKVLDGNGYFGISTVRSMAVTSDANGEARVNWTLGTRAGVGSNSVEASAVGFQGKVLFTARAGAGGAAKINVDGGSSQTGAAGQPLARPFAAVVTDSGHNRLAGVQVTFIAAEGGGNFGGQGSLTVETDTDGRALATLKLGPDPGVDNNRVEANFLGNNGFPAVFVASAKAPGDPSQTRVSGVVLDNSNIPIPGVTMRILGTSLQTRTDSQGQFVLQPAPVGEVHLMADGSTASRPGRWPNLEFEFATVAGQNNTLGMPVFLLPLSNNELCVSPTTGGKLTLNEVPGFSLDIAAGSATFPNGSRSGCVSVTLVHGDKVPMTPNFGQQPRFIITIQPPGVLFDPPAPVSFPNLDGLAPGQVTELYSFDHDLFQFVSIGPGTVSNNGFVVASNRGVGIIKGGWHCGGDPGTTGSVADCADCLICRTTSCEYDRSQEGQACDDMDPTTADDVCLESALGCRGEPIEIELNKIISAQHAGFLGNFAPDGSGLREYVLMGARSATEIRSAVEVTVSPDSVEARSRALVALKTGLGDPAGSTSVQPATPTFLNPVPAPTAVQDYSVVAGIDRDNDGVLSLSEASVSHSRFLRVVGKTAFDEAHGELSRRQFASRLFCDVADILLGAFLQGTNVTGASSSNTIVSNNDPSLSHAVGAKFGSSGNATATLYTLPVGSEAAAMILASAPFRNDLRAALQRIEPSVVAYFAANPGDTEQTFGPHHLYASQNPMSIRFDADPGLFDIFRCTNDADDLHLSFGTAALDGKFKVTVRNIGGLLSITGIELVDAHLDDLYDFDYNNAGNARRGATVQAGFGTLGSGNQGHIFRVRVSLDGPLINAPTSF